MPLPAAAVFLLIALDPLSRRLRGRSLSLRPSAAVWAVVLSTVVWTGVERLNDAHTVWTNLGWTTQELLRYALQGCLHATVVPTLLIVVELLGGFPDEARRSLPQNANEIAGAGALLLTLALLPDLAAQLSSGLIAIPSPPGPPLLWFLAGLLGLWLAADGANLAAGDRSLLNASPRARLAVLGGGLAWAASVEALSRFTLEERLWIAPGGLPVSLAVLGLLAAPAVLATYRALARFAGVPAYPREDEDKAGLNTLNL